MIRVTLSAGMLAVAEFKALILISAILKNSSSVNLGRKIEFSHEQDKVLSALTVSSLRAEPARKRSNLLSKGLYILHNI